MRDFSRIGLTNHEREEIERRAAHFRVLSKSVVREMITVRLMHSVIRMTIAPGKEPIFEDVWLDKNAEQLYNRLGSAMTQLFASSIGSKM